jgi:hypothetical protein
VSQNPTDTPRPRGDRNPDDKVQARQKRLYAAQLSGLPARQLVLEHASREGVSEATSWRDWAAVCTMNQQDFDLERETILSRLMAMRFRAVNQALKKNQLTSAAQLMDAIGRAAGEGQQSIELSIPNLSIKIEE